MTKLKKINYAAWWPYLAVVLGKATQKSVKLNDQHK